MNLKKNYTTMCLLPMFLTMIMAGCENRVGITYPPVSTIPTVTSTNPAALSTGVPFNNKITATYSEPMDPLSITTATFTLMQGSSFVSGTVSYANAVATFEPLSDLSPNTKYTATLTKGAKNIGGRGLTDNHVWSFTTGLAAIITPPAVIATNPANAATNVAFNRKIAATFSVAMDASTITASTFTVMRDTTPVSGFVSYSGITAIFAPSSNLAPNTAYTVTITPGARNLAGIALATKYIWSFTTGAAAVITPPVVSSTDPADIATGVALSKQITATFSKTMGVSTITTVTFTLMQGSTVVPGTVSNAGATATYRPSSNLMPNTTYTATITTGVKDLAGNALAGNYVWSFTTIVPYTVSLSSSPVAGGATSGGGTFALGSSATVSATPNAGYTFTNWKDGATVVSTNENYTFTIIGNRSLVANFAAITNTNTVSLSSLPGAGGTTDGDSAYSSGASVTVTAVANTGYVFANWKEGATVASTNANYNFTISGNRSLVANFTLIRYTATLVAAPMAGGNLFGAGLYNPGDSVTVITTSKPGYAFTNWTVNGTPVSATAGYKMKITRDTTIVANFTTGQTTVVLGTAARFAILSNSAITDIPLSAITGDVGVSPGARSSITGLTIPEVTGTIYASDDAVPVPAMLIAAKNDAQVAYLDAVNAVRGTPASISGNLNGLTLYPGLYESGSSIELSPAGFLYLDAKGDSNAVFVIRSATSITTQSTSEVVLAGNAQAKNIFWSAGSTATLGTNSKMKGTIIASTSISLLTGARLDGRALIQSAAAGQISLDQNIIVKP